MIKIKYPWDIEEEKEEKTSIIKFDWDEPAEPTIEPLIEGLPISKPEDRPEGVLSKIGKGLVGVFGTWEAKKRANPELQQVEDFGREVLTEANKWAEQLKGVDWKQSGSSIEQVAIIYEHLTGESRDKALVEIKKQKDLNIFFANPPEKYKEAVNLQNQLTDIHIKGAEPGKDIIGQIGWIGMVAILGYQAVAGAMSVSPSVWQKITTKEIKTKLSTKESFRLLWDVNYGKATKAQRKIFDSIIEQAEKTGLGVNKVIREGFTYSEFKPRFAFGAKLYAGIPIDEMVKAIVETGKITKDIANQLKVMNPIDTGLVFQQLSIASPAIASKVASQFVELIPQKITKIPKAEEAMTEEEAKAFERLKEAKIIPEEEIEPTKAELEEIEKPIVVSPEIPISDIAEAEGPIMADVIQRLWRSGVKTTESSLGGKGTYPSLQRTEYAKNNTYIDTGKELDIKTIKALRKEGFTVTAERAQFMVGVDDWDWEDIHRISFVAPKGNPENVDRINKDKLYKITDILISKEKPKEPTKLVPKPEVKRKIEKIPEEEKEFLKAEAKYPEKFAKEEIKEFKKFITEEEEEFIKAEREYPAKIIKEEMEELKPLATPKQIKKAHVIARDKALISEKGKMKPQYREIAKTFTDHRSIKDMTKEEAEVFIDVLERLPEPKYRAGKLVPPSIPKTMKLVPEGFFQKEYGEPTPIWLLTDQTYYATKLGIKPLVEPFEKGKQEFDLEFRLSSKLVDRMINKLNNIAGTSAFAKIKSKLKNVPTKAESNMAELINKYEATPPGLKPKKEDVFKYFRNLSKDIWRRENEVREKVDLPPIKYKQAYFRHTADAMAKEMMEGKYPFPQGIKYWGEKMVGKKIFNPMEFHRKLSDNLIDIWSKDIRAVTKAMLWNGLKEIYLAQPAKFLNEQLNAISKDLPEYKNLSPRDQAAYDQTRVMPSRTKTWLVKYVNQVLKGQETELDASLNIIVRKWGLEGIFNKVLSPFGRSIGRRPITHLFQLSGRAIISGVMGWVPRQILRNSFQPVQNLALYGVKATIKAYLPASVDKNLKGLMSESLFLKSYTGFEELPTNLMGKLEKVWLGPYGIVAVNNAKLGMKSAYWNTIELIRNPKFKKHRWADPQRTKDTPKGFLYPSEKEKLLKEMEFGSSATQYQYIPMGMPGVFRYKALVPLTRLQSWWMNYFTKFNREAIHRGFKGRPSWSDEDGPTLPWSRRVNYLKYLIIGGAILSALGYRRSFMLGVLPVYISPAGQVALGFYNYVTATEDWKREKALRQIYYSWKAFIPGSLAWRDFLAVWKGEKELNEILWYAKKEEKPKGVPVPSVKYEWEKKTKPKNIIKFDWD